MGFGGSYRSDPAPYATTTLAMNNKMRTLDGATFLSLPQSDCQDFLTQKTNSSSASGGESVHSDLMTSQSPSDSHFSPNKSKSSSGSGPVTGSYLPNWTEFFPPPPACPPSECDSSFTSPLVNRNQHAVKSQMSPMGSQRNFGSPALLKRAGGALQHLKPGEM